MRGADGKCVECATGEVGELLAYVSDTDMTGIRSFRGYQGSKEASERKMARNVFVEGDSYFRTGDLLRMDAAGRYYFVDRIGDTFRWKGENVATTEVAEVVAGFAGITEAIVYGAALPGYDGRIGMAALVLTDPEAPFDLKALAAYCKSNLASYAIPAFLRILPAAPVTGTFKHVKKELRDEGADPGKVGGDVLFMYDAEEVDYRRHTHETWAAIVARTARL